MCDRVYKLLAIGFNLGLALTAASLIWSFWFGTPETAFTERIWLNLFCMGIALSGSCWVAGSSIRRSLKSVAICGIVAGTVCEGVESAREFDADARILQPGRIERVRFVHDGLGLSFAIAPGMLPITEVDVTTKDTGAAVSLRRARLRFDEEATLFKMASPTDPGGKSSPIRLQVKPFTYSRLDAIVLYVLNSQNRFAAQPGETLVRPLRCSRVGGLDVMDFELMRVPTHLLTRYVYVRSGSYLLNFVLRSRNEEDRLFFDQFVQSIRVRGHKTRFDH
jgi:hypothetical protein